MRQVAKDVKRATQTGFIETVIFLQRALCVELPIAYKDVGIGSEAEKQLLEAFELSNLTELARNRKSPNLQKQQLLIHINLQTRTKQKQPLS